MLFITTQCQIILWFWLHKVTLVLIATDQLHSLRREELRLVKKSNWPTSECCNKFRLMLVTVALGKHIHICKIDVFITFNLYNTSAIWNILFRFFQLLVSAVPFQFLKKKFISTCSLHNKNLHLSWPDKIVTRQNSYLLLLTYSNLSWQRDSFYI